MVGGEIESGEVTVEAAELASEIVPPAEIIKQEKALPADGAEDGATTKFWTAVDTAHAERENVVATNLHHAAMVAVEVHPAHNASDDDDVAPTAILPADDYAGAAAREGTAAVAVEHPAIVCEEVDIADDSIVAAAPVATPVATPAETSGVVNTPQETVPKETAVATQMEETPIETATMVDGVNDIELPPIEAPRQEAVPIRM